MKPNNELLREFIEEAKVHIGAAETGLLRMEEGVCDDDTLNEIFRAVHSIKGTAGFFEMAKIVELSHVMETLFGRLRDHEVQMTPDMVDVLLTATDVLKELVCQPTGQDDRDIASHVASVKAFLPTGEKSKTIGDAGGLSAWDMWNQLTAMEEQPVNVIDSLPAQLTACVKESSVEEVRLAAEDRALEQRGLGRSGDVKTKGGIKGETVRVGVELLDDLLNIVGEMVLRRNQLLRIAQNAGKDVAQLDVVAQGIDSLTTNLQEKVMKTRLQPVANVFNKFPRIVRELSRKMGKEVDLVLEGMSVELDRSIIEALVDPITHLVRNALDHGIESQENRMMQNKSSTGVLSLRAYHESGRVVIDISDDGAGIDLEIIKAKALVKGWISEKEAASMREAEALNLIMRPGFSTAEQVTDISGRGVGMDVVKTNIEKLGGKVEICTEKGAGTTFRLILPLTLAIISSFIVEAAGDCFAVPQANVKELILIQPGKKSEKRIEFIQTYPVLRLRDQLLPLIRLIDILGVAAETAASEDRCAYFADEGQTFRILVLQSGSLRYGLLVDAVYDTEEILVKPVPSILRVCGCYSGVTVLGDGRIAMIIDPESIRVKANLCEPQESCVKETSHSAVGSTASEQQYLLLFKSSGGEMLGIDLSMVSRVEEIGASRIQKIGSKLYFSFRGQSIRIIRPEHYLPISNRKSTVSKCYVILPKLVKHTIGIIAEEICDVILTRIQLDTAGVSGLGVIGSTLVEDQIVTLLDVHELFEKAAPEYYSLKSVRQRNHYPVYSGGLPEMRKTLILLAEDTPFFARTTKSYLESAGYEVITAENGREAFEILSRQAVDAVISDIEMPLMNGFELVRAIRASETLKHLPVIALTSLSSEASREKGLRAGFDIYEVKLDRVRLLDSVRKVLEKRV